MGVAEGIGLNVQDHFFNKVWGWGMQLDTLDSSNKLSTTSHRNMTKEKKKV